jgi:hypothetical protein
MVSESPMNYSAEPSGMMSRFEQLRVMVESEFDVEEGFLEHNVPTFYVRLREDSKEAFLRLTKHVDSLGLIPILRKREGKVVLQAMPKPPAKPSRKIINIVLFLATLGTVLLAGYLQWPDDITGAIMFVVAIMAILGSHEMGHKLLADKHAVEATYPYFIPGPPPLGTFGAVIQQKSLPPNKDALFDVGFTGPVAGFVVTMIVALIGVKLSVLIPSEEIPEGAWFIPVPLLLRFITLVFPPSGSGDVIRLHPVAFAGWVGMFVTLVNLVPAGMLDGGHVARSFLGARARTILAYIAIALLFVMGPEFYFMAILALFFSTYRHPGPLDDVSRLTTGRKLATLTLVLIFILCIDWFRLIQMLSYLLP